MGVKYIIGWGKNISGPIIITWLCVDGCMAKPVSQLVRQGITSIWTLLKVQCLLGSDLGSSYAPALVPGGGAYIVILCVLLPLLLYCSLPFGEQGLLWGRYGSYGVIQPPWAHSSLPWCHAKLFPFLWIHALRTVIIQPASDLHGHVRYDVIFNKTN